MNKMKRVIGLGAALFVIGQCPVSRILATGAGKTNLTAEVLIFSGRPNPTWQLQDTSRFATLKARLMDLPEAFEREPPRWSRLGFAGFRIQGGETFGLPADLRIYEGVIQAGKGNQARYLKDTEGLEQSLIAEAKRQALEPPVKEAIAAYESTRKAAK